MNAAAAQKRLLVVIPALNESRTVEGVIRRIPRDIPGIGETIVTVIDDGSSDDTAAIAQRNGAKVYRHRFPRGVGSVFRRACELIIDEADILVCIDGDGQFNSRDARALVGPIVAGEADCVIGSRFLPGAPPQRMGWRRRWGNKGMAWLMSHLIGQRIYDAACGFRAYSAETVLRLNLTGRFTYTQEALLDISQKRLRLKEAPVRVRGTRRFGRSRVAHNLLAYAYRTLLIIGRAHRDFRPMRFFGTLGGALIAAGGGFGLFLLVYYVRHGQFSPHKWAGFVGGFLVMMGAVSLFAGLLADMLDRIRVNQEELLYNQRALRWAERRRELQEPSGQPPMASS